jgi:SGNH domain (fused to AT3 domains)
VASFATSVIWTRQLSATAYFVTPTRMWEFGAGGLLALVPLNTRLLSGRAGSLISWVGLATIGAAALFLTSASAFPGVLALVPVLGTLAVIIAGAPQHVLSPTRIARLKPIQLLGDLSYSVYLWHWPLVVLVPLVLGRPLIAPYKLAILVASLLLAYGTKLVVEDPFRFANPLVAARPSWTILATVTTAVVIVVGCAGSLVVLNKRNASEAERIVAATKGSCFGAAALGPGNACKDIYAVKGSMTPAFAKSDTNLVADPGGGWRCEVPRAESEIRNCVLGVREGVRRTIAMLGDSHAMHLMEPMRVIAAKDHWQVQTYFKSACSATGASDVVLSDRPDDQTPCARWGAAAIAKIAATPQIDTVVFSNVSSAYLQQGGAVAISPARYRAAWAPLIAAGKKVLVIADVPRTNGMDIPDCLAAAGANASACNAFMPAAKPLDSMAMAAAAMKGEGVTLLDMTDRFCIDGVCHARIGGVIVYSDSSHLTNTYARTLAPYIELDLLKD